MSQPKWKRVGSFGDVNPLDYGGGYIYIDETGVYPPEMEMIEPGESEDDPISIYRLTLEPHTYVDGVLSDNPFHPAYPVWYAKDLPRVCASMDVDAEDLIAELAGSDPIAKADAYQTLIGYFGPNEFDSEPLTMTREEAEARYADEGEAA